MKKRKNIAKYALRQLYGFKDIYTWMLDYDSDFFGYMAGVLKITNLSDNCCV